jgi:ABC-type multidrug transport system fused ATPase/permease subunit
MRDYLRYLQALLAPHRNAIVLCSALALAAAGLGMVGPIALGRSIDAVREGATARLVVLGLLAWLAVTLGDMKIRTYLGRRGNDIAWESISRDRLKNVDALLRKPLAFHYGRRGADMTEKIHAFEQETQNVITGIGFYMAPAALAVVAALGYLATLDARVALALGASVLGLVWYKYATLPAAMRSQLAWRAENRKVQDLSWDPVRNVLVV